MDKNFQDRKVKFYILERKDVRRPKIMINEERKHDDFDISQELWQGLSNRASDDYGFVDRDIPRIPYFWSNGSTEKIDYHQKTIKEVKSNIKRAYANKIANAAKKNYQKQANVNEEVKQRKELVKAESKAQPETILRVKIEESYVTPRKKSMNAKNEIMKKK